MGECVSALVLDLSNAFETINHYLLLAKSKAYRYSLNAVKSMHNYLNNRKQQVQINNKFSSESTVLDGVPDGSIDRPILFNFLFFISKNKDKVKICLCSNFKIINNWFYENFIVLNSEKCHFVCIGKEIKGDRIYCFLVTLHLFILCGYIPKSLCYTFFKQSGIAPIFAADSTKVVWTRSLSKL